MNRKIEKFSSPLGLRILWFVYRAFGLAALHAAAATVGLCVWIFSPSVRRASPRLRKTLAFTRSLADKLAVMSGGRRLPSVSLAPSSPDAAAFVADVQSKRGVFILSSHLGAIEVLPALGECDAVFHAWMDVDRTAVFTSFYLSRASRAKVKIHPISDFGPETVFAAGDALDAGDCLLMAADRTTGRTRAVAANGMEFRLAEGAFRLARSLEHPTYFVACVREGGGYRVHATRLDGGLDEMSRAYASALSSLILSHPDQWFDWEV